MAIYSVKGPDGNTYDIEGPENARQQDIIAAAERFYNESKSQALRAQIAELQSAPVRPAETSGFGAARAAGVQNIQADLRYIYITSIGTVKFDGVLSGT